MRICVAYLELSQSGTLLSRRAGDVEAEATTQRIER